MNIVCIILMYILALLILATWKKLTGIRELFVYILLSNAILLTVEVIYKSEWFMHISIGV